ncbi:MAG: hypothetical protein P4M02_01415 [Clostridia bacterium]|nr:hypothetical protein [Clostridia bacterium]
MKKGAIRTILPIVVLIVLVLSEGVVIISQAEMSKHTMISQTSLEKKSLDLDKLIIALNSNPIKVKLVQGFTIVKQVNDALYTLHKYDGCDIDSNQNVMSDVYGVKGIYQLNNKVSLSIGILKDNSESNGGYILSAFEKNMSAAVYKYKDSYIIFEVVSTNNKTGLSSNDDKLVSNLESTFYKYFGSIYNKTVG